MKGFRHSLLEFTRRKDRNLQLEKFTIHDAFDHPGMLPPVTLVVMETPCMELPAELEPTEPFHIADYSSSQIRGRC